MTVVLRAKNLAVAAPGGRTLCQGLQAVLSKGERVAMVGRNGVGKSTLVDVMTGLKAPQAGHVWACRRTLLVPQHSNTSPTRTAPERRGQLETFRGRPSWTNPRVPDLLGTDEARALVGPQCSHGGSPGESKRLQLRLVEALQPDLLVLDEPTADLDADAVRALHGFLDRFEGAVLAVSHDRAFLERFEHFFCVREVGCRLFTGSLSALEADLAQEETRRQASYVRRLQTLAKRQSHDERVRARRRRKKNLGRIHELGRGSPHSRLNGRKSYAQESQGRVAKIADARLESVRQWADAGRRALSANLPLSSLVPTLPNDDRPVIDTPDVQVTRLDRIAVTGPNGSGKTTFLEQLIAHDATRVASVGMVTQNASNWMRPTSLIDELLVHYDLDRAAAVVHSHRFPLELAQRRLDSLSPGERVRAALICTFATEPAPTVLVLDEPSASLDFSGGAALARVLRAWPGGLVIASHDRPLLRQIDIHRTLCM